jgi:hypothetical protein
LESYEIEELDRRIRALEEQKNNASL